MTADHEAELLRRFPSLLREMTVPGTLMSYGIETPDEWFEILDRLFAKLEPLGVVAAQVKEKFGGLRVYLREYTDEADDLIVQAEREVEALRMVRE